MARVCQNAKKQWVANQDFDLKNLQVSRGEILPVNWTSAHSRNYLRTQFGDSCIIWTDKMIESDSSVKVELEDRVKFLEQKIIQLENQLVPKSPERAKRNRVSR